MSRKLAEAMVAHDTAKAYRLVGEFMQSWSFVENELNRGIAKLTGLATLEATIVQANMGVRDKIHALKTLLYLYSPTADRDAAVSLLNSAASMSEARNMIAHTMFWAHEKGGVEFAVVKAKGKLTIPNTVWGKPCSKRSISRWRSFRRGSKPPSARLRAFGLLRRPTRPTAC